MPFEAAVEMESELAEDLRAAGYTVTGAGALIGRVLDRCANFRHLVRRNSDYSAINQHTHIHSLVRLNAAEEVK